MPVPLHAHSWYSLLEGTASPEALLRRAAVCGYSALALTDTNNLYGAVAFTELARACGVRPLLGACLRQHRTRCVALIAEPTGYSSLCRILSRLHLAEGPVRLEDLLAENAAGLHVLVDDRVLVERLREPFGRRLWLEVVRPARTVHQEEELLAFGRRLGVRPVASTAAHFATPAEYPAFRRITTVRQGGLLERTPRQLAIAPAHHLADPEELWQRFRDLPEAVRNTDLLAKQLRSDVLPREVIMPPPRLPRHHEANGFLHLLCERGLRRRHPGDSPAGRQRLREEFAVIAAGDLAGYFLVVRDIARYARRRGYGMALRGSAGNSFVCYLLEITDVDPLRFGLPLERFLNLGRLDLPDIDLDFDWKVRDEVIAHIFGRYGPGHTAMISSHLCLQPRSAFREAAKLHGLSSEQVSRLLETLSERISRLVTEDEPEAAVEPPRQFPLEAERWPRLRADARLLLGRPHHLSIHPGGLVITPGPLEEYVPLQRAPKGVVITQFEKDAAEQIGLVKIDLLGNRSLALVEEATRRVKLLPVRVRAPVPEAASTVRNGAFEDSLTLQLLRRGDTLGVTQLESPALRHLLIQMRPQGLDDVIQALALIRPGAASVGMKERFIRRRRGLEAVRSVHPCLEPLLGATQGLMVFEDDALGVIRALTGLPAADADRLRKRVSKHRTEAEAQALTEEFLAACSRNGVGRVAAAAMWVQLAKFNRYSFCKSHAVSYGLIAWKAASLKAHQPLAFWAAALNNNQGMYPRRVYVEAAKRAGIAVRLPCVNASEEFFCVEDNALRTGLEALAALPGEVRAQVLADRRRHGPFRDLADLRRRVRPGPEALALLIRCGALDFTGLSRPALFLESDLQSPAPTQARLFQDDAEWGWSPAEYAAEHRVRDEWQILGYVVGPPLMTLFRPHLPRDLITSRELPDRIGRRVRLAGVVATARHTLTTDGRDMQFVTLEDEWGLIEVTLFPGTCPPVAYLTVGPYLVTGVVEEQYDVLTVTAHQFARTQLLDAQSPLPLTGPGPSAWPECTGTSWLFLGK